MWPQGVRSAGISCGIKRSGKLDLGVLVADEAVSWAGTFTQNAAAAACVQWSRERLGAPVRALVVNSGNANACTGSAGARAVQQTVTAAAQALECPAEEILVSSTGPIGIPLNHDAITSALPETIGALDGDTGGFARAILTTDSYPKVSSSRAGEATVVGVAKGAAMLAPNMATMLAFIATDAVLDGEALQRCLSEAVDYSFNRLCIDACESTNDAVFLLATSRVPGASEAQVDDALQHVCGDLALKMARDAEGASKLVRVVVEGAHDEASAVRLAKAVAASALWRAAASGGDPNWGRVLAALGTAQRSLDLQKVSVAIGGEVLFDAGEPAGSLAAAAAAMHEDEFTVSCSLGGGDGRAEVLTSDLTERYVALNAGGLT